MWCSVYFFESLSCRLEYNVLATWLSRSGHHGCLSFDKKPITAVVFLQDVTTGRTPKEVVLRPGKGRHVLHQAKMYVKSSQVDLIKTSSIFDSLDSLLWDILGFNISDAIINVPALSARLFCDVSDWIWEDISDMTTWFLFCVFNKHNNYMCVRWFIHYVTMPCLFRFKPGW